MQTEDIDGRDAEWHRFIDSVDELLSTGRFSWALPVLSGIRETVERTGRVSAKQRRAFEHIRDGLWEFRGRRRFL